MHHFGCGMNWIKGYYMIVKVKNETFWFSTYSVEMHSLTSSSFITCICLMRRDVWFANHLVNFVELVVTNLTMVYDLWNKPMVSIATKELKYERGHLPPSWLRYWSLMKFGPLIPMNTFRYFQLFWKRFASLFQNVLMCVLTNHLHIINFTEIRPSF